MLYPDLMALILGLVIYQTLELKILEPEINAELALKKTVT